MRHAILGVVAVILLGMQAAAAAPACDRICLNGFVDNYLAAMVAHDPAKVPLATNVRFTEDGQALEPGDGLWNTITGLGTYKHYFADPETGQVGFFGIVLENGAPTILVLRLKIDQRKVSEIETIVVRKQSLAETGVPRLEAMGKPEPIWDQVVPPAERMTRQQLIDVANAYFTGLQGNDGKGNYPFADDCDRMENGMMTTNNHAPNLPGLAGAIMKYGCKQQFETGFFRFVTRIRDRRFLIVDPEHGVVFAFAFFDHAGKMTEVTLTDGTTMPTIARTPLTWEIGEAFKIEKGKIRRVEADLTQAPYTMKPGW